MLFHFFHCVHVVCVVVLAFFLVDSRFFPAKRSDFGCGNLHLILHQKFCFFDNMIYAEGALNTRKTFFDFVLHLKQTEKKKKVFVRDALEIKVRIRCGDVFIAIFAIENENNTVSRRGMQFNKPTI